MKAANQQNDAAARKQQPNPDTLQRLQALQDELDDAPAWKRKTVWAKDRRREIKALSKGFVAFNLLDPDGKLWKRLFLSEMMWAGLETLAAREGIEPGDIVLRALARACGVEGGVA